MEVDAITGAQPTNAVVMFDRSLSFTIVRRMTLKRNQGTFAVLAEYNKKALEYGLLAFGNAIATFSVQAPISEEAKKICVNVKEDIHGIIQLSLAQLMEEIANKEESEMSDPSPLKDGEEDAAPENKKKVKKTNLVFTTTRPLDWTDGKIQKACQVELAMALKDKLVQGQTRARTVRQTLQTQGLYLRYAGQGWFGFGSGIVWYRRGKGRLYYPKRSDG
jgi:heat shock protein 4